MNNSHWEKEINFPKYEPVQTNYFQIFNRKEKRLRRRLEKNSPPILAAFFVFDPREQNGAKKKPPGGGFQFMVSEL